MLKIRLSSLSCGFSPAGFDPDAKEVILCEDNLTSQNQLNRILTHELIHAFDVCRAHYDNNNLEHLACSEVRAANLSGEWEWEYSEHAQLYNTIKSKSKSKINLSRKFLWCLSATFFTKDK